MTSERKPCEQSSECLESSIFSVIPTVAKRSVNFRATGRRGSSLEKLRVLYSFFLIVPIRMNNTSNMDCSSQKVGMNFKVYFFNSVFSTYRELGNGREGDVFIIDQL